MGERHACCHHDGAMMAATRSFLPALTGFLQIHKMLQHAQSTVRIMLIKLGRFLREEWHQEAQQRHQLLRTVLHCFGEARVEKVCLIRLRFVPPPTAPHSAALCSGVCSGSSIVLN